MTHALKSRHSRRAGGPRSQTAEPLPLAIRLGLFRHRFSSSGTPSSSRREVIRQAPRRMATRRAAELPAFAAARQGGSGVLAEVRLALVGVEELGHGRLALAGEGTCDFHRFPPAEHRTLLDGNHRATGAGSWYQRVLIMSAEERGKESEHGHALPAARRLALQSHQAATAKSCKRSPPSSRREGRRARARQRPAGSRGAW